MPVFLSLCLIVVHPTFEIRDGMSMCSDHWLIFWCGDIMVDAVKEMIGSKTSKKRLLWREACSEDLFRYRQCLEMELENLDIPAEAAVCNDPCSCNHKEVIQLYFDAVVGSMMKANKRCIPMGRHSNAKVLGWDSELKRVEGQC